MIEEPRTRLAAWRLIYRLLYGGGIWHTAKRKAEIERIARSADPAVEGRLFQLLADRSRLVRDSACGALALHDRHRDPQPIVDVLWRADPLNEGLPPDVSALTIDQICELGVARFSRVDALPRLIEALKIGDRLLRVEAAHALGTTRSDEAVEPLVRALDDRDVFVRREAVLGLGRLRAGSARAELERLRSDPDKEVQRRLDKALARIDESSLR
ncbi:MAG: hypothetical protein QOE36_3823 [Gaiellaceae bacterium]|nr:hypothetical protein [Gaiellaceae bacterium]